MCVVESRSGGTFLDAERFGDLGRLQPEVVAKDEDRALFRREAAEATLDLVAVRDGARTVGHGGLDREHTDVRVPRSVQPRLGVTGVYEGPVNQTSNRSGSRSRGSSRQAITSVCCTASSARPRSRRIRCASPISRSPCVRARMANASRSPRCACSTRSRSTSHRPSGGIQRGRLPLVQRGLAVTSFNHRPARQALTFVTLGSRGNEGGEFDLFILRFGERAGSKVLRRVRDSPGHLVSRLRVVEHARCPVLRGVRQQPPAGRDPGCWPRLSRGRYQQRSPRCRAPPRHRPLRRPRRLHHARRGPRPRACPRPADALLRAARAT